MNDSHGIAKPPPVETDTHRSPLNSLKWSVDCEKSDATSAGLVSGSGQEEQQQMTSLLQTGVCSPERTPPVSGTLKRPLASMAASGTPRRVSSRLSMPGSPADATASSPSGSSPDRKIWMRACNGCGHELHVRRTKCTECGSLQSSKRSIATAKEEAERAATAACAASLLREEAEAAASQLTRIIAAAAPAKAVDTDASVAGPAPSSSAEGEVRVASAVSAQQPSAKAAAAAARAKAFTEAVARLSPDQLLKLRRMRKLRALLAKVPADAKPRAAVPVANPADDAISMLASVACSS